MSVLSQSEASRTDGPTIVVGVPPDKVKFFFCGGWGMGSLDLAFLVQSAPGASLSAVSFSMAAFVSGETPSSPSSGGVAKEQRPLSRKYLFFSL